MGLNATEWAAYSEGISAAQLRSFEGNAQAEVHDATAKQTYTLQNYTALSGELEQTKSDLEDEVSSLAQTKEDIVQNKEDGEKAVQDEKTETLSKEITVDKFCPNQGMNCGMGMGMGDNYTSEGAITLTVEELAALGDVLADFSEDAGQTDNSQKVADHLNNTLTSGAKASVGTNDDGTKFVEIKRANGSSVKICDANGNGALDVKDYDFCDAIKQAKEAIEKMNTRVEGIEKTTKAQEEALTAQKEQTEENIAQKEEEIENYETKELPNAVTEIDKADEELVTKTKVSNDLKVKIAKQEKAEAEQAGKADNKNGQSNNIFATNPNQNDDNQKQTVKPALLV